MRIYVAAPWTHRDYAADVASRLRALGHAITHDWWNHDAPTEETSRMRHLAGCDFTGVAQAQAFVLLNLEKSEGKAVESGMALAFHQMHGTPMLIGVGERHTNIFQYLPEWVWFDDVDTMLQFVGPTLDRRVTAA